MKFFIFIVFMVQISFANEKEEAFTRCIRNQRALDPELYDDIYELICEIAARGRKISSDPISTATTDEPVKPASAGDGIPAHVWILVGIMLLIMVTLGVYTLRRRMFTPSPKPPKVISFKKLIDSVF